MGNLHNKGFIKDKKFLLAFLITVICSFICGTVLCKAVIFNEYLRNFADNYIFYVFNFQNSTLFLSKFLTDLVYFYIIFFICYFSRLKYLALLPLFLRGLFFGIYSVILIGAESFGGVVVAIFVFIPATLIAFVFCYIIAAVCKIIYKKYALLMPLVFSVISIIIYAVLINVLFRLVIIIV